MGNYSSTEVEPEEKPDELEEEKPKRKKPEVLKRKTPKKKIKGRSKSYKNKMFD